MTWLMTVLFRVWALAIGSAIIPRMVMVIAIGKMPFPPAAIRAIRLEQGLKAAETILLMGGLLLIPANRGLPEWPGQRGLAIFMAVWAVVRLMNAVATWRLMARLVGFETESRIDK